jgi:acetyl-CoA carboxylase biotin carboxyl carrier protein
MKNINEIKTIVELMSEHDLTEFKIEADEMHLCIRRGSDQQVTMVAPPTMPMQMPAQAPATAAAPAPSAPAEESAGVQGETIDSPMVGTFYSAASPDAAAFVQVGDSVTPETTVCIVEAMKVMNEIKAEKSGVIKEILVGNSQPVEYGQPLFVIG